MVRYVTMEVTEGAYEVSCPDPQCDKVEGKLQMSEIENIVGNELAEKHKTFRLNTGKTKPSGNSMTLLRHSHRPLTNKQPCN